MTNRRLVDARDFLKLGYGAGGRALDLDEGATEESGATFAPLDVRGPISQDDFDGQPSHLTLDHNLNMPYHEGTKTAASDAAGWARYLGQRVFKSRAEAEETIRRLVARDNEQFGGAFGGPVDAEAIIQALLFQEGPDGVHVVDPNAVPLAAPAESVVKEHPGAGVPDVSWYQQDLHDTDRNVTEEHVRKTYGKPGERVYQGYIPIELLKPQLVEEQEPDIGYDWSELQRGGAPPPPKVLIHEDGTLEIIDGNHRVHYWTDGGYDYVPAWIIDQRKPKRKKKKAAPMGPLGQQLNGLRHQLAQVAQQVIDAWQPGPDGDDELGMGGICDRVADAMADVIGTGASEAAITEGGQEGDDHAFLVVYNDTEAYEVDVPPGVYETGGGYSWKKIEGAQIGPDDVVIQTMPRNWIEAREMPVQGEYGENLEALDKGVPEAPYSQAREWPQSYSDGVHLGAAANWKVQSPPRAHDPWASWRFRHPAETDISVVAVCVAGPYVGKWWVRHGSAMELYEQTSWKQEGQAEDAPVAMDQAMQALNQKRQELQLRPIPPPPMVANDSMDALQQKERARVKELFDRQQRERNRRRDMGGGGAYPDLLGGPGEARGSGGEEQVISDNGSITHYASPDLHWHRFVFSVDGTPVSGLSLKARRPRGGQQSAVIDRVYTKLEHQRQGYARALLDAARAYFREVKHSKDLTNDGARWKSKVGAVMCPQCGARMAYSDGRDAYACVACGFKGENGDAEPGETFFAPNAQRAPWVAVDLDGTLLAYEHGMGARGEFGPALEGAAAALRELKSLGWRVSIFTARLSELSDEEAAAVADQIAEVLHGEAVPFDDVWVGRKPQADYFVDDKAIPFRGDWDEVLVALLQEGGDGVAPSGDIDVEGGALIDTADGDPNDFEGGNGVPAVRHDRSISRAPVEEKLVN